MAVTQETFNGLNYLLYFIVMSRLLSPTDCYYCRSNTNIQRIKFPCDCLIYTHPDCYKAYVSENKEAIKGHWKLNCPQCSLPFTLPDQYQIQVNIIQDDEELQPFTRREIRRERCKVCAVLSVQSAAMLGLLGVVVWGYARIILGII